jgi:hypothetical protein
MDRKPGGPRHHRDVLVVPDENSGALHDRPDSEGSKHGLRKMEGLAI